jgi:hypothetical protein
MKVNAFLRFLTRITSSATLDSSLFKLMIIFFINSYYSFLLLHTQYYRLIASIWLYFLVFFRISGLIAYLSMRFEVT